MESRSGRLEAPHRHAPAPQSQGQNNLRPLKVRLRDSRNRSPIAKRTLEATLAVACFHCLAWVAGNWTQLILPGLLATLWVVGLCRRGGPLFLLPWIFWLLLSLCGLLLDLPLGSAHPILAVYKRDLVRGGRIAFCTDWGWVDRRHSLTEVLVQMEKADSSPVSISHWFFGGWGRDYALHLEARCHSRQEVWRCLQLLGERCEREESQLPWYYGSRVSAYHADDLASVYLTIFRQAFPSWSVQLESRDESLRRFDREGAGWTQLRIASSADFQPRNPALRPRFHQLFRALEELRPEMNLQRQGPFARLR